MKRLRLFLVEIVFVPILLAWLFLKYPEAFDTSVPWITLLILWHLTWEFVIDPLKGTIADVLAELGRMGWVLAVLIILTLSVLYVLCIKGAMIELAYDYTSRDSFPPRIYHPPLPPSFAYDHTSPTPHAGVPLIKSGVFATVIPFTVTRNKDFGDMTASIPYDENRNDPLMMTYVDLASLGNLRSQLLEDQTRHTARWSNIDPSDIQRFLGHSFQGYILGAVAAMQTPQKSWSFDSNKGAALHASTPIAVPDEQEYSIAQLQQLLLTLKDVDLFSEFTAWHWKVNKLKVPRGTLVTFVEKKSLENSAPIYVVHFQRQPDFTLDFVIEFSGRNQGERVLPPNFVLFPTSSHEVRDVYSYGYAISMNFRWNGDHITGQPYAEWAENLFNGLQKRFVIPEH
jgi:hypothetical protein